MENGTYTPKMHLYKPALGEYGWGEEVDENFDIIDALTYDKIGAEPTIQHKSDAFNCDFGNTEGTVCQGNDPRLQPFNDLPAHADTTTKYGGSTDTLYGHTKASATVPKENSTATYGNEVNTFARGDHIHPKQKDVAGSAGTTSALKTKRKISTSVSMTCKDTYFDGTKDIDVEVVGIKAENIKGDIPAADIPTPTATTKGAVIVGDGLEIKDGVIKVKPDYIQKTKVTTKGTIEKTDIVLGTIKYATSTDKGGFSAGASRLYGNIPAVFGTDYKFNKPSILNFKQSETLPSVIDISQEMYEKYGITHYCTGTFRTQSSNPNGNPQATFNFIRKSDNSTFFTIFIKTEPEGVSRQIKIPDDWNFETDTFDIKGEIGFWGRYGSSNINCSGFIEGTYTETIYL